MALEYSIGVCVCVFVFVVGAGVCVDLIVRVRVCVGGGCRIQEFRSLKSSARTEIVLVGVGVTV